MKVKDVMMRTAASCSGEMNLGAAVKILWDRNCGILPVVDAGQQVIGVITDRDICIALGTRNRLPGEITVGEVASSRLVACRPDDDIRLALASMAEAKVRRLPVLAADGKLEGILSMDDIVIHSETRGVKATSELSYDDVVETLKAVYRPYLPEVIKRNAAVA
ncbi:MAG TPA: CBS domain-containing protein [Candidatus Sulfotelmatobacter sp.]|nr:CBS domain-containing protein [Candidatus Sulfotelmatobacter sp.]